MRMTDQESLNPGWPASPPKAARAILVSCVRRRAIYFTPYGMNPQTAGFSAVKTSGAHS